MEDVYFEKVILIFLTSFLRLFNLWLEDNSRQALMSDRMKLLKSRVKGNFLR